MGKDRAVGLDRLPVEVWKVLDRGVLWLVKLLNKVMAADYIPIEWRKIYSMPLFKDKANRLKCEIYIGIKIMSQKCRVVGEGNRLLIVEDDGDRRERQQTKKYRAAQRVYDRFPRKVIWEYLRYKSVPEHYF